MRSGNSEGGKEDRETRNIEWQTTWEVTRAAARNQSVNSAEIAITFVKFSMFNIGIKFKTKKYWKSSKT